MLNLIQYVHGQTAKMIVYRSSPDGQLITHKSTDLTYSILLEHAFCSMQI